MNYVVITSDDDGEIRVQVFSKTDLLQRLEKDYYGDISFITKDFLRKDVNNNTAYWGNSMLIIKGEIVTPVLKEVVQSYDLK